MIFKAFGILSVFQNGFELNISKTFEFPQKEPKTV